MSAKGSTSSKRRSVTGVGLFDVLMPLATLNRRKGPEPSYYLVRSKSGRPLNVAALRQKPTKSNDPTAASQISGTTPKPDTSKEQESKTTSTVATVAEEKLANASASSIATPEFTAEQDAKLLEMKAANKTWKDIVSELGRSKSVWQARWKVTRPQGTAMNSATQKGKSKGEDGSIVEGKKANKSNSSRANDSKKEKALKKANVLRDLLETGVPTPSASVVSKHTSRSEPRMSLSALLELLEVDAGFFSPRELRDLFQMLQGDEDEKWLRIASRFYDQTGRRMHEEDIRDAVEALVGKSR
ncbi:hypothetical protein K461DRAFT_312569 [Myriangium duriaei CBS 260.36]|uniref:Myb-like domain-containing protein n=1 Tax=Myriangium duriaei CBS 260.36 TaxID=1168546 RepID=A0A9P4J079_9PEZI|nr:hypothetical protein K461DRAFT_312569 [Myriangium duriaei CBS 260.36]